MKAKGLNIKNYEERYDRLVAKLVHFRKREGLSQLELAKRLGTMQPYVSRIEAGLRRIDAIELEAYIQALGMTREELDDSLK